MEVITDEGDDGQFHEHDFDAEAAEYPVETGRDVGDDVGEEGEEEDLDEAREEEEAGI